MECVWNRETACKLPESRRKPRGSGLKERSRLSPKRTRLDCCVQAALDAREREGGLLVLEAVLEAVLEVVFQASLLDVFLSVLLRRFSMLPGGARHAET